ncbi:unnamed protein product [Meloidogyne enterolobii]|uniref:Uncharacterized protein n=1 Tax=Meloidogyne enterolobii TaxID=390850 RepID=A0ACB1ACJ1_MELEN
MNKFHILLLLLVIFTITVLCEATQTAALANSDSHMLGKREVAAIRAKRFGWGCCGGGGIGLFWGGR